MLGLPEQAQVLIFYQFVVAVPDDFIGHFGRIKSGWLRPIEVITSYSHISRHSVRFRRYFGTRKPRMFEEGRINLFSMKNLRCLHSGTRANISRLYS
jgi:hypothetical protein